MLHKKKHRHDEESAAGVNAGGEGAATGEPIRMMPYEDEVFDDAESRPEEVVTGEAVTLDVEALQRERDDLLKERDELKDQALRLRAEFENYRKRMQREAERIRATAAEGLAMSLLPVLDNLYLAVDHAGSDATTMEEGVRMVLKQFVDVFGRNGIMEIKAAGQPFDPNVHDAIMQEPSSIVPPMTVLREFQRGYEMGGRALRAPKVVVSVAPQESVNCGDDSDESASDETCASSEQ